MNVYATDKLRNVTLLGHSGVGKTALVEAALFNARALDRMGTVADGNTVSDFDEEEIRRGASLSTTYAAVEWKGRKFNLIDCPGDFDYVAEQRLGLFAGDVALIVSNAKNGVAVGSEKAIQLAEKMKKPVALFINSVDEPNASFDKTVAAFQALSKKFVPLDIPIMHGEKMLGIIDVVAGKAFEISSQPGDARKEMPVPEELSEEVASYRNGIMEQIAETSEELMEKFFAEEPFSDQEIEDGLRNAIIQRDLFPIFGGSATSNLGTSFLMDMLLSYFPTAESSDVPAVAGTAADGSAVELKADPNGPLAAFVFKTIVDPFVGRISYFRVFSGTFTKDQPAYNLNSGAEERISALYVMRGKKQIEVDKLEAGDIGAVTKLTNTRTNDTLTFKSNAVRVDPVEMPVPVLMKKISPVRKGEEDKIMQGLAKLGDEDPSFKIENNAETGELVLSGQGEMQLEILVNKLKSRYGTQAVLEEPRVAYRETIRKKVKIQGKHKKQSGGHGQYGDVWIVFEPGTQDELEFAEEVVGGAVPKNYFPAVEKGLQEAVTEGVLAGYPVVRLKATLVDGSYHEVDSNEMSFKLAARLAYRNGLPQADPVLLEPISHVMVHIPEENLGDIMGDMSKRRGRILGMGAEANSHFQYVEAEAPSAELMKYATDLRSMTQGRGWFTVEFARYEQAPQDITQKVIAEAATKKENEE